MNHTLKRKGIRMIFKPTTELSQQISSTKDEHPPYIYRISCECGKDYIGMSPRRVKTRFTKYQRLLRLYQPDKLAVAQHAIQEGHIVHCTARSW